MENLGQILEDFLAASRGFCEAAEAVERLPLKDFLMGLEVAFSRAYSVGALLPELEPDSPDLEKQHHEEGSARLHAALHGLPSPDPRDAQRWQLFDAICEKLGDMDQFWKTPDPTKSRDSDDDWLSVCVHDTYRALRWALDTAERGAPASSLLAIAWEDFTYDWGRHAVDALRALYFPVHVHLPELEPTEEDDEDKSE